jgi:hypothetical protein
VLTRRELAIVVIALRALEDRLMNGGFDFVLEPEFEDDSAPPTSLEVFGLARRLAEQL